MHVQVNTTKEFWECGYFLFPKTSIDLWCWHADSPLNNARKHKIRLMIVNSYSTEDLISPLLVYHFYTFAQVAQLLRVM